MQVHDELLLQVPEAQPHAVLERMQRTMESAITRSVPLKADGSIGYDWFES
ncbi:MAG: DNA polymerase [Phycisphaerales bacterium]